MPKPRKGTKRVRRQADHDQKEQELTAALFGGTTKSFVQSQQLANNNNNNNNNDEGDNAPADEFTFQIDRVGDPSVGKDIFTDQSEDQVEAIDDDVKAKTNENDPEVAWVDDDELDVDLVGTSSRLRKLRAHRDETNVSSTTYENRLRERFATTTQITAHTQWAVVETTTDEDDGDTSNNAIFLTCTDALLATRGALPANILGLERCPDLNMDDPNHAVVQAVDFHKGSDPNRPMALTAGLDKTLRFFQVTAEKCEKIHGFHFPRLPIYSASFLGTTGTVVVSGRRSYFYLYDSVAGKLDEVPRLVGRQEKSLERCYASSDGRTVAFGGNDGYVMVFDVHNKSIKKTVKLNGSVRAICFQGDNEVLASGSDGDVYRWDLRGASRVPLERFSNQDGSITSTLAASSRTLAVGSESGVVNLYSEIKGRPKELLKSIMNIRTPINRVCFNADGNMLAISSQMDRNALKIVHVPSGTVFSNWPTSNTPLGYVWSTSFSPGSKFLAIGNDKGKCLLYKLKHYYELE